MEYTKKLGYRPQLITECKSCKSYLCKQDLNSTGHLPHLFVEGLYQYISPLRWITLRPAGGGDSVLGMAGLRVSGRRAPHLVFQTSSLDVQLRGQDQRERWRHRLISLSLLESWLLTSHLHHVTLPCSSCTGTQRIQRGCWTVIMGHLEDPRGSSGALGHIRGVTAPCWVRSVPSGASQTVCTFISEQWLLHSAG